MAELLVEFQLVQHLAQILLTGLRLELGRRVAELQFAVPIANQEL